ncbi:MAG TPA: hypothetical protein VI007_10255 [bacterium]
MAGPVHEGTSFEVPPDRLPASPFGLRVRIAARKGWSQSDIARKAGVSRQTVPDAEVTGRWVDLSRVAELIYLTGGHIVLNHRTGEPFMFGPEVHKANTQRVLAALVENLRKAVTKP